MTTATTTARRTAASGARGGFSATLASEWTKITSLRSTLIMVLLGIGLGVGITALLSAVVGGTWGDLSAEDQADFDPVLGSLVGMVFTAILFAVLGVTAVASEYSSGMIRVTLTATPRRGRVLLAKAAVVAAITLVAGLIASVAMFLAGQAIYSSYGIESARLSDGDALQTVLGTGIGAPIFPLIGAALAVLLRNTAGAITTVMALIFAPSIFGPLLPSWWQENVLRYLPGPASDNLANASDPGSLLYLEPAVAAAVVIGWIVLFLGAAYVLLTKRDA
jgi:ABC-2 type transport system permease protein